MIDYRNFFAQLEKTPLGRWSDRLDHLTSDKMRTCRHGDFPKWLELLNRLPALKPSQINLNQDELQIGAREDCDSAKQAMLENELRELAPWRKGPYNLFGMAIDAEWRSDQKWQRLKDRLAPLEGRSVLDIGTGNGYHLWRMHAAGARIALGIDPTWRYVMQFQAIQKYLAIDTVTVLPLGIEDLPADMTGWDTVFSMGVLYHRRSPLSHLASLRSLLRPGGELVLETLIIDGPEGATLLPRDRYAQMTNVWLIPSVLTLLLWLERTGFTKIQVIGETLTTSTEQRVTDWSGGKSLIDFLDPADNSKTLEGYPAPKRAIFLAERPLR